MNESITVSALNEYTRMLIERDEVLSQIWVAGEISGLSLHQKSGHLYFSLRDSACSVRAVMFCAYASALRFLPKDGMFVEARCKVSLYERDGSFQLYVYDLLPKGVGVVQKQFETVKTRLQEEGLFQAARKRLLPLRPKTIAVITSTDAAALQDIISVVRRRNPTVMLKVYSSNVQGALAVKTMVRAIAMINEDDTIDLAIIARGGGSSEDLWYFNDEELVRAAATLRVPFVSAIGHETDVTLLDLVSDSRAPTPSAAAELAVCDLAGQYEITAQSYRLITTKIYDQLKQTQSNLVKANHYLKTVANHFLSAKLTEIDRLGIMCRTLDPKNVLLRGYTRVKRGVAGIESVTELQDGDSIDVIFKDGAAACTVNITKKGT